jgi:hypothetical protein
MIHRALGARVLPLLPQGPVKDNLSELCDAMHWYADVPGFMVWCVMNRDCSFPGAFVTCYQQDTIQISKFMLPPTASRPDCLDFGNPYGVQDQIFVTVRQMHSITTTNRLILFGERIPVCSEKIVYTNSVRTLLAEVSWRR